MCIRICIRICIRTRAPRAHAPAVLRPLALVAGAVRVMVDAWSL